MIDSDLIGTGTTLRSALADIHNSTVIQQQIDREIQRIISGDADQPIEDAAKDLLKYRAKIQLLKQFQQICAKADREIYDEAQD